MTTKHGNLSINSDNIFPIIKKWMYSDKDIFVREMISNACDAITKLKKLDVIGEVQLPEGYVPKITVQVNDREKTLRFIDNGIGMTAAEVEKNITEIAFSGATEFLEKYKDKTDQDQIIGHFGLGFYSAFMVAEQVDIDTLSFEKGSEAVHWECDGGTEYEIGEGDRAAFGTTVTLHLAEDSLEFANEYKVRETLEKYCAFMPVEIYLEKEGAEPVEMTVDEDAVGETDIVLETFEEDGKKKAKIRKAPEPVNDIHPLWAKTPSECTDDEYKEFYRHVFLDYKEPLFWIHLNMDYPFNLKGILYFPRINTEYESIEGTIKLYNNQVFIADNIKEVIPEYLLLLKGVIDCPDLPLNVSRSALQNDGFVQKISDYISKKVADKLSGMCKTDRENYEKYWDDISPFIKFGILRDEKFAERMMSFVLYKDIQDKYLTLEEYLEKYAPEEAAEETEKEDGTAAEDAKADAAPADGEDAPKEEKKKRRIYYVTDAVQQSQYINMFREQDMNAVVLEHSIDAAFITQVEQKNEDLKFQRIDAELTGELVSGEEVSESEAKEIQKLFRKALDNKELEVRVENLKDETISAVVTYSEESRRLAEMMRMYGMAGQMPGGAFGETPTLILNAKHPLVQYVREHKRSQKVPVICQQLFDLALLANRPLSPEEMARFVARSNEIMLQLAK